MPRSRSASTRAPSLRKSQVPHAIAALEATARDWQARAERMAAALDLMRRKVREAEEAAGWVGRRGPGRPLSSRNRTATTPLTPAGRAPRGQGAGAIAVEILRSLGRPARVNEILAELEKRGVTVGGQRPYNTLAATLMQRKAVKRVGKGLFASVEGAAKNAAEGEATPAATAAGAKPKKALKRVRAKARSGPRTPRGRSVGDQALDLLRAHGKPMRVNDLLAALERIGVTVGGKRPANTLTATMSRAKGVTRAGPGLYQVIER